MQNTQNIRENTEGCRMQRMQLLRESRPDYSEDAVTSVMGEMILMALVIVLVSIMAASIFNLIPGGREPAADISMTSDSGHLYFWHHGGDWIKSRDLSVRIYRSDAGGHSETLKSGSGIFVYAYNSTSDECREPSDTFDLGGKITAVIPNSILSDTEYTGTYDLRLIAQDTTLARYDGVRL